MEGKKDEVKSLDNGGRDGSVVVRAFRQPSVETQPFARILILQYHLGVAQPFPATSLMMDCFWWSPTPTPTAPLHQLRLRVDSGAQTSDCYSAPTRRKSISRYPSPDLSTWKFRIEIGKQANTG